MSTTELSQKDMETFLEALGSGATVSEAAGISRDTLEAGYGLAFSLYNSGNFKDAGTLFQALCVYDHNEARFWNGLAGCRQMNDDLPGAIDAYGMAAYASSMEDPAPLVHAGLCCLKQGDKETASGLFDAALELGAPENAEHIAYRERAKAMLELLKKEA